MASSVTARSSRLRLVAMLSAVAAVHAAVLLTSDVEGPGSAQLRLGAAGGVASAGGSEAVVLAALVVAAALACAALVLAVRPLLAPAASEPAPTGRLASRRALLLSGGGAVA